MIPLMAYLEALRSDLDTPVMFDSIFNHSDPFQCRSVLIPFTLFMMSYCEDSMVCTRNGNPSLVYHAGPKLSD